MVNISKCWDNNEEKDTSCEVVHCVFGEEQGWVRNLTSFFVK